MFAKSSAATIAGILLLGALTGCTQGSLSGPNEISLEGDTPSQEPPFETALNYEDEIVLAKTELEQQFLTIALASCKRAQTDGFVITDVTNDIKSIFRPSEEGMWPDWPFEQVSIRAGVPGLGQYDDEYKDYPPRLFDPCNLEIQARRGGGPELLEHKVVTFGGKSFGWRQHQGGANFEEVVYQVQNGLITAYQKDGTSDKEITYGPLSSEHQELLDLAAN